jgi:glycosyltransferase involved in cell wall biosynthesis
MKPNSKSIIINGHFLHQPVAGVQRYAKEVINQFDLQKLSYRWIQPPKGLHSASFRQLWMQSVMPFRIPKDSVFWSPTNIGPVFCENHVLTLHDIAAQLHPEWYDMKYVKWRAWILPSLLNRVKKIITPSNYAKQTILEHYKQAAGKTEVVYNGVNHKFFYSRNRTEIETVKKEYHLKKPFVLYVGTLSAHKNTKGLLKAWQSLPKSVHKEIDLVIAGKPNPNIVHPKDGVSLESIRFIGYVAKENLPVLYSAAELFVFPSFHEGFGLPVMEAMACGTPAVTSNATALKEIAGPSVTVDPHSTDDLRNAILELICSPSQRKKMSDEGINWASRFTWEKTAGKVWQILNRFNQ